MKNLLILIVVAALMLFVANSSAQTFGIKGGFNMSTMLVKLDGDKLDDLNFKMTPGFHIGPTMGLSFSDMFSLQTELMFSSKGFKDNMTITDEIGNVTGTSDSKVNLYYLDIPLYTKATFGFNKFQLFGIFGPYMGVGLIGVFRCEGCDFDKEDVKFGKDESFKRLDFGLAFGTGIELNAFQIGVNYNLGLKNISAQVPDRLKQMNRVLSISVGYRFGKHRTDKSDL